MIDLTVSPSQKQYLRGSVVEGIVEVEVVTINNKPSSADKLKLRMVGRTKTADSQKAEHWSHDVELASFGGKVAIGTHTYPFSVVLPANLPPTVKDGEVVYTIEAHLNCPGMLSFDADAASIVEVLDTLPLTQQPTPQHGMEEGQMQLVTQKAGPSTVVPTQGTLTPYEGTGSQGEGTRPPSHACAAWTGCILFCPLGCIAVYYSRMVDRDWERREYQAARYSSSIADNCSWLAMKIGLTAISGILAVEIAMREVS